MKVIVSRFVGFVSVSALVLLAVIFTCDLYIDSYGKTGSEKINEVTYHHVGLLLGTSKYTTFNTVNLFYKYRLDAAVKLYKSGKICNVLVSGDNRHKSYNEPQTFYNDLVQRGVEPHHIYLDYAGFRTLDSVVRAKKVFKQDSILLISQQFHNERALFLADKLGIKANAFHAQSVDFGFSPKVYVREKLARVKAFMDVYILNTQPKFLGEEITIS